MVHSKLFRGPQKVSTHNCKGYQAFSFDFFTLYTSLSHDIIKERVVSLVNWCFNRDSKTYPCTSDRDSKTYCTSDKAGVFSNKKYHSYKCWACAELCEAFTILMENISVQFEDMVHQHIVGIHICTNCNPLIADLCFFCYQRVFILTLTNLNSTTLYTYLTTPFDILTTYSPSNSLNFRNIFLLNIQRNFSWTKLIFHTKKFLSLI